MDPLPLLEKEKSRAPQSSTTPASLVAASLAALVGMLVWAGVSFFTGYEVGYVAWGVGLLVGLATVRFGGRGMTSAGVAAGLTVAGIAGGKLLGTSFVADSELEKGCQETFTGELYQELVADAAAFAQLPEDVDEREIRRFMIEHYYSGADSLSQVQPEELKTFLSNDAPKLRKLHSNKLSFEDWYAQCEADSREAFEETFSVVQANIDELDAIDLVFVFLGVSTAFGMVRRADAQAAEEAAEAVPPQIDEQAAQHPKRRAA